MRKMSLILFFGMLMIIIGGWICFLNCSNDEFRPLVILQQRAWGFMTVYVRSRLLRTWTIDLKSAADLCGLRSTSFFCFLLKLFMVLHLLESKWTEICLRSSPIGIGKVYKYYLNLMWNCGLYKLQGGLEVLSRFLYIIASFLWKVTKLEVFYLPCYLNL